MKNNEKIKKIKLANSILGGGIKNKNAFTLIELLAIIVILAIIAVITVPIILNVIDNSKKGAAKDSAYGFKDAVNKYYVSELYNNQNLKLNGDYTITDKGELSDGTNKYVIPFSGNIPTGGTLTYENNVLKNGCITIDEYKATIENGEVTTVEKGICEQASSKRKFTVVSQEETGKLLPGDELAIDSEHFYVISSDENETVMLAKYNLLVGNTTVYNPAPTSTPIDESTQGYGLQSENALGDVRDTTKEYKGVLKFSSTFYWEQDFQVSGSNYPYVLDQNSDLYTHVENYRNELEKMGAHISEARLLKYQEATNILGDEVIVDSGYSGPCNAYSEDKKFIFLTSYWLGTAFDNTSIHYIAMCGRFSKTGALYPYGYGVRPVIVVDTSDIDLK